MVESGATTASSRPFVHINCAVSVDAKLAYAGGKRALLSGPEDLRRVQELRAESDAILVGVGTILADDPSLRVHWELLNRTPGRPPRRIVLDSLGRTPPDARILDGSAPTLIATSNRCQRSFPPHVTTFQAGDSRTDIPRLLAHLHQSGIRTLMVEGGSAVIGSFLASGSVDRMTIYQSPLVIGDPTAPPLATFLDAGTPGPIISLERTDLRALDNGLLATYVPRRANSSPAIK